MCKYHFIFYDKWIRREKIIQSNILIESKDFFTNAKSGFALFIDIFFIKVAYRIKFWSNIDIMITITILILVY